MTRAEVINILLAAGLNPTRWVFMDERFEPVSQTAVAEIASACLDALPPELVTTRQIGGGKSIRVPRWTEDAGDCENHSIVLFAWIIVGNWLRAVRTGEKRGGLAAGPCAYLATPRVENGFRSGPHSILWHVDHEQQVCFYEFGDNAPATLTPAEIKTCTWGMAA